MYMFAIRKFTRDVVTILGHSLAPAERLQMHTRNNSQHVRLCAVHCQNNRYEFEYSCAVNYKALFT